MSDRGFKIDVDGKTGERSVLIIPSTPFLERWLEDHPRRDDADAPLWCRLKDGREMSFRNYKRVLERLARRADVEKPVNLTNFRKSRASALAREDMTQSKIEQRQGWVRNSKAASRYVALFDGDADDELARIHGLSVESDEERAAVVEECPRCRCVVDERARYCDRCGQALAPDAHEIGDAQPEAAVELATDGALEEADASAGMTDAEMDEVVRRVLDALADE